MKNNNSISAESLSKAYQLGQIGTGTISRDIERFWITKIMKREDPFLQIGQINDRTKKSESDVVWSLKDLNFDIKIGDAVGVIGRNGAGKSTLLKLLSRVTAPTEGRIRVKGRIASLLEVGTGFHPELSGRENIFLNGAILGMRKAEIKGKFDEIVNFAGIERYIDTPVKRYSSGMYVRLAFSVAAHLDSEILVVDEVLAVGDAEFQNKCITKMTQISKNEGRTILFVSHNIASIKNLCNVGILLDKGRILSQGEINNVVDEYYILLNEATQSENLENRTDRIGNGKVRIKSVSFSSVNGNGTSSVFSGCELEVKIEYKNCSTGPHDNNHVGISIRTIDGVFVFSQNTRVSNVKLGTLTEEGVFLCRVKNLPLSEDVYFIDVNIKIDEEYADYIQNAARFSVEAADFFGTGRLLNKKLGSALVKGDWSHVSAR